jgi:hypothetical protein
MRHFISAISLLCVGLLANDPCAASASTSAAIEHLRFQLVDLDPTDGIAPSITVDRDYFDGTVQQYFPGANAFAGDYRDYFFYPTEPPSTFFDPLKRTVIDNLSLAGLSASASAFVPFEASDPNILYLTTSSVALSGSFLLSAHTRLLVTADVPVLERIDTDNRESYARVSLSFTTDTGYNDEAFVGACGPESFCGLGRTHPVRSGGLELTIDNSTAKNMRGGFSVVATAYVSSVPIPEPATAPMLIGGVGFLVWIIRGRTRRGRLECP